MNSTYLYFHYDIGYLTDDFREKNINLIKSDIESIGIAKDIEYTFIRLYQLTVRIAFNNEEEAEEFAAKYTSMESYTLSNESKETESEPESMIDKVFKGEIPWDNERMENLFKNYNGWWGTKGMYRDWYVLPAMINAGYIEVERYKYEPYTHELGQEIEGMGKYEVGDILGRGNDYLRALKWDAYRLLQTLSDEKPLLMQGKGNFYSSKLNMYAKAGEGDVTSIIWTIQSGEQYMHLSYNVPNYYFLFRGTELYTSDSESGRFTEFLEGEMGKILNKEQTKREERKVIDEYRRKQEKILDNYEEDTWFTTGDTSDFLSYYKINVGRGYWSTEKVREMIKKGEIIGEKKGKSWMVPKYELKRLLKISNV